MVVVGKRKRLNSIPRSVYTSAFVNDRRCDKVVAAASLGVSFIQAPLSPPHHRRPIAEA